MDTHDQACLRDALSHVIWIGGGTDSGKSTIAKILASQYGLYLYDYDRHDVPQVEQLALTNPRYRAFLDASPEENWVRPEPQEIFAFTLQAFQDRFPLVIQDLLKLPRHPRVVIEGHGLRPDLIAPLLTSKKQAIWLVPTEAFKWASMERRGKPSFRNRVTNPERAKENLFQRDMLVAADVRTRAAAYGLTVLEIDGSLSAEQVAEKVARHLELP